MTLKPIIYDSLESELWALGRVCGHWGPDSVLSGKRMYCGLRGKVPEMMPGVTWVSSARNTQVLCVWLCIDLCHCTFKTPLLLPVLWQCPCSVTPPPPIWDCDPPSKTMGSIAAEHWQSLSSLVLGDLLFPSFQYKNLPLEALDYTKEGKIDWKLQSSSKAPTDSQSPCCIFLVPFEVVLTMQSS